MQEVVTAGQESRSAQTPREMNRIPGERGCCLDQLLAHTHVPSLGDRSILTVSDHRKCMHSRRDLCSVQNKFAVTYLDAILIDASTSTACVQESSCYMNRTTPSLFYMSLQSSADESVGNNESPWIYAI